MSRERLLIAAPMPRDLVAKLEKSFDVVWVPDPVSAAVEVKEQLTQSDIAVITVKTELSRKMIEAGSLRLVANVAVGVDNIDVAAATERGIVVANTPGVLDSAVADLAMMLILVAGRSLLASDDWLRSGKWVRASAPLGVDIAGKRLGLLGMGRIGRKLADRALAHEMDVSYFRPSGPLDADVAFDFMDRDDLIRESDFVSLHFPLTPETARSFGRREFDLMKESAYLVNTARGALVDERALVDALRRRAIAGAALDVMTEEPISGDHPLCAFPNVVLTPHIGSSTVETRRSMMELAVNNVMAFKFHGAPVAQVNLEAEVPRRRAP